MNMFELYTIMLVVGVCVVLVGLVCAVRAHTEAMLVHKANTPGGMVLITHVDGDYPWGVTYLGEGGYYRVEYIDGTYRVYEAPTMEDVVCYLRGTYAIPYMEYMG